MKLEGKYGGELKESVKLTGWKYGHLLLLLLLLSL